jgi:hypothetical protein
MDLELQRKLVLQWGETGRILEEIRRRELRAMSAEQTLRMIEDILSVPPPTPTPEHRIRHSGLVEQQDLFRKLRPR